MDPDDFPILWWVTFGFAIAAVIFGIIHRMRRPIDSWWSAFWPAGSLTVLLCPFFSYGTLQYDHWRRWNKSDRSLMRDIARSTTIRVDPDPDTNSDIYLVQTSSGGHAYRRRHFKRRTYGSMEGSLTVMTSITAIVAGVAAGIARSVGVTRKAAPGFDVIPKGPKA